MGATPAWPPRSLPRLFVRVPLGQDVRVELDGNAANYLSNVLRLGEGADVLLFDGSSGEWRARIVEAGKKRLALVAEQQTRPLEQVPELTLAFAPIKRAQTDWLVEKATELGVRHLQPVMTRRTVAERIKRERLESIAVEATEQCGRTLLPTIAEPLSLPAFLQALDCPLVFADETGGVPLAGALHPGRAAILIGPEGGFTPEERDLVRGHPQAVAVSLGPRILRAETAALAAVTTYMALAGDWR